MLCGIGLIIIDSFFVEVVVLVGDIVNLICRVKSILEVKIVWIKNEWIFDDMIDEEFVFRYVNIEIEGVYKCKVFDNRG